MFRPRPSPLRLVACLAAAVGLHAAATRAGFTTLGPETTGVTFTNVVPASRHLTNQIALNGSGVALADVDGDGRTDVFLAGYAGAGALYRNRGGWRFEDVTTTAFGPDLMRSLEGTGAVFADVDGDGDADLLLNTLGQGTRILSNDGRGRFSETARLNPGRAGSSATLADVDGDGDLDLYVANYRGTTVRDDPGAKFQVREENGRQRVVAYNGRPTSEPDLVGRFSMTPGGPQENGEPDVFYLNDGKGGFTEVSWTGGAFLDEAGRPLSSPPYDWGLSAMFRDFTGDGRPDLYVCNDFQSEDRFWVNDTPPGGPVRFRAAPWMALRHTSAFSMGVDGADIDRDGVEDFVVLDMLSREHRRRNTQVDGVPPGFHQPGVIDDRPQFSHNTLFLGRGDGTFSEIGRLAGVSASEWAWTPLFLDVDLDGYEDLLVSNGHEMDMLDGDVSARAEALKASGRTGRAELLDMRRMFRRFDAPNAAFRNRGDLTFEDVTTAWGLGGRGVEHGMAAADLDDDGDLDLVLNTLNGPAKLLRNDAEAPRLRVRLKGRAPNTAGIGARIRVVAAGLPAQTQQAISGGRYLSGDDPVRTFALGGAATAEVEVVWRDGTTTLLRGVPAGTVAVSQEGAGPGPVPKPPAAALFEDVSGRLNHVHVDVPFDDFARQPGLPRELAQAGPGVTWGDLNGDGLDDLVVGSGQGGVPGVFTNDARGGFAPMNGPATARPTARDLATSLIRDGALIVGVSNHEDGRTNGGLLRIIAPAAGASGEVLTGRAAAAGPLAMADVDGDGEPEIFVGVRAQAGRYPETPASLLVRNVGGRLAVAAAIAMPGPANGAVFTDLDGDARPELVVATEWGPVAVFRFVAGLPERWDPPLTGAPGATRLSDWSGWWRGVTAGDFDGDGRMDLIAGNWGRNHFLGASAARRPLRLRHGDPDGDGVYDLVESYVGDGGIELPARKRALWAAMFPDIPERFPTLESFGAATLSELLGPARAAMPGLGAVNLDSGVLLNRGERFEWRALPVAAQLAPASGLVVADFDGDGLEDVFVAQNFFGVCRDDARYDAGRGLLLRGDGHGRFAAAADPGIAAWGEQRGAATADFDGDGRPDLVVGQNASPTMLFRNAGARPGLRVRLAGPARDADGIGASLRWIAGGVAGPRREIRAGGGYWSVDSPVTVLGTGRAAGEVEVRWPDGTTRRRAVAAGVAEVTLRHDGKETP